MLGRDHALSGGLAFAAAAPMLHATPVGLAAGVVLTAGAGLIPDIDEPGSTISREGGFLTMALAWVVRKVSGGHRKGTHSLIGLGVFTAGAWCAVHYDGGWPGRVTLGVFLALLLGAALHALHLGGHHGDLIGAALGAVLTWLGWDTATTTMWHVPMLAVCVALGMLAHLVGDMCTHDGCPLLYPLSRYEFGLLPQPLRIRTGKFAEHRIFAPLLLAALGYFIWRDVSAVHLTTT